MMFFDSRDCDVTKVDNFNYNRQRLQTLKQSKGKDRRVIVVVYGWRAAIREEVIYEEFFSVVTKNNTLAV